MGGRHVPFGPVPDRSANFQRSSLSNEISGDMKDKVEQESANWQADDRHQPSSHYLALAAYRKLASGMTESTADETGADDDTGGDAAFFYCLDAVRATLQSSTTLRFLQGGSKVY